MNQDEEHALRATNRRMQRCSAECLRGAMESFSWSHSVCCSADSAETVPNTFTIDEH